MPKMLYLKLAVNGMKKNTRSFVPFIISSTLCFVMIYILKSLSTQLNEVAQAAGGIMSSQQALMILGNLLSFGLTIVNIFTVIFLFYTNSYLLKRRKKELGLYSVLGMTKPQIARVLIYELLISLLLTILFGTVLGVLFERAAYNFLYMLFDFEQVNLQWFSMDGFCWACEVILVCFILMGAYNIWHTIRLNSIEMLHAQSEPEKEPKANWLLTLLGIISLSIGYYMALTIQNPVDALVLFFVAVIFVIIGTYCLFTAGSVFLLKCLQKNKHLYYKTSHFINISNMKYRMKQNGVSLANICILSTMVLVTASTTVSLYANIDKTIQDNCPRDYMVTFRSDSVLPSPAKDFEQLLKEDKIQISDSISYQRFNMNGGFDKNKFDASLTGNVDYLFVSTIEDYNRQAGTNISLKENEILIQSEHPYDENTMDFFGTKYNVLKTDKFMETDGQENIILNNKYYYLFVSNQAVYQKLFKEFGDAIHQMGYTYYNPNWVYSYGFNSKSDFSKVLKALDQYNESYPSLRGDLQTQDDIRQFYEGMFGGLLFLGVLLSILFMLITIVIMYYKQISEGMEDAARFDILHKVGLEDKEVRKTIRFQVLTVFFLPLIAALIHLMFAFPMIRKLLYLVQVTNMQLLILATIGVFIVFSLIYIIAYSLTSRIYYSLIRSQS